MPHRSGWGSNNLCSGPDRPRWLALGRGKPSTAWMAKGKPGSPTFERPKWTFSTGISVASRDFSQVKHLFWDKNMFHVGSMGFLLHFQPIEQPKGYDLSLASQRYDPWEARARRAPGDSQRPSITRSIAASTPSEVEYVYIHIFKYNELCVIYLLHLTLCQDRCKHLRVIQTSLPSDKSVLF